MSMTTKIIINNNCFEYLNIIFEIFVVVTNHLFVNIYHVQDMQPGDIPVNVGVSMSDS